MDYLPIAVRGHMTPTALPEWNPPEADTVTPPAEPDYLLVLDTETTTDMTQALLFGCYRFYQRNPDDDTLRLLTEGLFYGDDLPDRDPDGYALLQHYARRHTAPVDRRHPGARRDLPLQSRREFVNQVLWKAIKAGACIVGFNLPFDLSRIGVRATAGRGANHGAISLQIWDHQGRNHPFRPWISDRSIDSKRHLIKLTACLGDDDERDAMLKASFLDLRTLAFALTDTSHSLASACEAFHVVNGKTTLAEYGHVSDDAVDYCRADVTATAELYEQLMTEYRRHPIEMPATQAYSPASIAKAYFRVMRIPPPLQRHRDLDPKWLGAAMSAFYGGRSECRIRKTPVPVTLVDFTAMYATVNALMDTWSLLTCQHLTVDDVTTETQDLLAGLQLDDVFQPEFWKGLIGLALVDPDGDVLPIRARYTTGHDWTIAVNPVHRGPISEPLWYSLADVVASTLLTGRPPRILQAVRFTPHGRDPGLWTTNLRGDVPVQPATEDLFRAAIEQRQAARVRAATGDADSARLASFLKVFANAGTYGVFAEYNRKDLPKQTREHRTVNGAHKAFACTADAVEDAGGYCFPPIATAITGAARLMLAALERCITDTGGSWAFADTDSMAVVTTKPGGLIPCPGGSHQLADGDQAIKALSGAELDAIRARFQQLNPYDTDTALLKVEADATCYAVSAKRYALYHLARDGVVLHPEKVSEHGLGHLLDPSEDGTANAWIRVAWRHHLNDLHGYRSVEPPWLDQPALSRTTISSPRLLQAFDAYNTGKPYSQQIKPGNFFLIATADPLRLPATVDTTRFRLAAPYHRDTQTAQRSDWRNIHAPSDAVYRISTASDDGYAAVTGAIAVRSYRNLLDAYFIHPEAKHSAGDQGGRDSYGVLSRKPVGIASISTIGKEANHLELAQHGLTPANHLVKEWLNDGTQRLALEVLQRDDLSALAATLGVTSRRLRDVLTGRAQPRPDLKVRLIDRALQLAGGDTAQRPPDGVLVAYLAHQALDAPARAG